ncbi:hypothetical protein TNCV_251171 [Trichonephila clavipes]|nr:hypothetical protein TNCV_251171 [Trichonephila clavipes]
MYTIVITAQIESGFIVQDGLFHLIAFQYFRVQHHVYGNARNERLDSYCPSARRLVMVRTVVVMVRTVAEACNEGTTCVWSAVIFRVDERLRTSEFKSKPQSECHQCDEAHFWLNGYVNKQNCRIWSEANPQVYVETPLHPQKLTVWCALWVGGILLQKR